MFLLKNINIFICALLFFPSLAFTKELVIATSESPPFISEQPGNSFLSEVFNELSKEMGVKFIFKFMPWKRCEIAVKDLKAWGMIPYVRTKERDIIYYCSDKLYTRKASFFYYSPEGTKKNITYSGLKDLKPYKIGGVIGYYYENIFHEAGIELDLVIDEKHNFMKLRSGRVDLVPSDETTGWSIINSTFPREQYRNFFTLTPSFNTTDIYLMTSKGYPNTQKILARFNTALKKIKENKTFQHILDKRGLVFIY